MSVSWFQDGSFVRAQTNLQGKKLHFKELIYAYMIIIDNILKDQGQRLVIYHLINNIVEVGIPIVL